MAKGRYVIKTIKDLFDFSISTNGGLTKSFVNAHKGPVPVFGASQNPLIPSYGYIQDNLDGIKYYDNCLTYNKDGASGLVFFREGHFTISEKVVPLVLFSHLKDQLDYQYLKYAIENESRKITYSYSSKATKITFKNIKVKIPINDNEEYDLIQQKKLAQKYKEIEKQRELLNDKAAFLKTINVILPESKSIKWKHVALREVFSSIKRGNSKYTKTYCKDHFGQYPVYSADNDGPLGFINQYDYDGEFLTISINGLAGKMSLINGKFSVTADRVVCIPNNDIDIRYIMYVAEPLLRNKTKGRKGDLGKNEFTKLTPDMIDSICIPIPVSNIGTFDAVKQNELAQKYDHIRKIKNELANRITELTTIVIA